MSIRLILTITVLLFTFFGLISVVGNVHVAEFYGILTVSLIMAIVTWFKLGRFKKAAKKITTEDFH
jgi:hypothetical protein